MKQKIAMLLTGLLLCGFAQAQVSKESYEKAVDLLNCKTVELTLPKENIEQYQQQCPCNKTDFAQINKFLTSVGKLDMTVALSTEVESLKKSFKENWKKQDIVSFLSESIFTDMKYQKIVAFAEKRKGKAEFDKYKASLKKDLANALTESGLQETVAPTSTEISQLTIEDRIAELEKAKAADNDKSWFSGITSQIIVVSIIVSSLLSFLTLLLVSRLFNGDDSEASNNIKNYVKRKIDEATWDKGTPSNNVVSVAELRDANNRIRALESQIEKIKQQLNTSTPIQSFTTELTCQETRQPELKMETFFLSTPNSDGSFNESSAQPTYRDGGTIYRFTKTGSNRAKFQIDEKDASAKLALQFPDKNIDPVCDAVNAFNPKATRISTVEQGEAELQGNKWIVNKKAKIHYEN